jgi:hypothetical protein
MDAFLYIGYRVDCRTQGKISGWTVMKQIPECDDPPPTKDDRWLYWPNDAAGSCDSYLCTTYYHEYWCPFGHAAMWEHLNSWTIDVPADYNEAIQQIRASPGYLKMQEIYGPENVTIKWGIFKGQG